MGAHALSLLSPDSIIQADATLIVGIIFIVALRKALPAPWRGTKELLRHIPRAIFFFMFSAAVLAAEDIAMNLGAAATWAGQYAMVLSELLFVIGLAYVAYLLGMASGLSD